MHVLMVRCLWRRRFGVPTTNSVCNFFVSLLKQQANGMCTLLHRGYNIGIRLVDEFLAKTKQGRCSTFREAAEAVARQALPMFLNISANVTNWNAEGNECSLVSLGGWGCQHCSRSSSSSDSPAVSRRGSRGSRSAQLQASCW